MTALLLMVMRLDAQSEEDRRSVPDIVGEVVDPYALTYLATQRALRAMHAVDVRYPTTAQLAERASLYLEAFVLGSRWGKGERE